MPFFDNLAKKVSKGLDQASFEAEKLVRVNKLKSELAALRKELLEVKAALGDKVMELAEAGSLSVPELEDSIKAVTVLMGRVELQEKELAAVQAETYEDKAGTEVPAATAEGTDVVPEATEPPAPVGAESAQGEEVSPGKTCPQCGAEVPEGAVFCPNCGAKVG